MLIPSQRELFDLPDDVAYLNCAYQSPLLRAVREAGERGVGAKARPWEVGARDFFEPVESVRRRYARLIGASADDIALIPSVSYGISVAAKNLDVPEGDSILLLAEQFPSNVYTWRNLARSRGANLVTVHRPRDGDWTRTVLAYLKPSVCAVALPPSHWTDGSKLDLVAIGERCREMGAALILDGTQSFGAMHFDVGEVKPDFAVCAAYKWLLGPYSAAFLYAAPSRQGGDPIEHNWINRAGSEDFAGLVDYTDAYRPGARRYDVGEVSNFILIPMMDAALAQLEAWGIDNIAETLQARTSGIAARARALGLEVPPDAHRSPHMLGVRFPSGLPEGIGEALKAAGVYLSVRGDSLRVAPHLYTTDGDIDRLFDVLERFAR